MAQAAQASPLLNPVEEGAAVPFGKKSPAATLNATLLRSAAIRLAVSGRAFGSAAVRLAVGGRTIGSADQCGQVEETVAGAAPVGAVPGGGSAETSFPTAQVSGLAAAAAACLRPAQS